MYLLGKGPEVITGGCRISIQVNCWDEIMAQADAAPPAGLSAAPPRLRVYAFMLAAVWMIAEAGVKEYHAST